MIVLYEVCSAHDPVRSSPVHKLRDVDSWREVAAFRLDGGSLTLANLRQSFPENGEFHFRARVVLDSGAVVWQDLLQPDDEAPRSPTGGPPHIRALPINYDDDSETVHEDDFDDDEFGDFDDGVPAGEEGEFDFFSNRQEDPPAVRTTPPAIAERDLTPPPPPVSDGHEDFDAFFGSSNSSSAAQEQNLSFGEEDPFSATSGDEDEGDSGSESSSSSSSGSSSYSSSDGERSRRAAVARKRQQQQHDEFRGGASSMTGNVNSSSGSGAGSWSGSGASKAAGYFSGLTSGAFSNSSFGKNTFGFLKKAGQAAMTYAGNRETTPNTQQKGALDSISRKMRETFDSDNREHVDLLQTSWKSCFPQESFERSGPQWRLLGFTKENPLQDKSFLGPNGMLGLHCLAYYLEHNRNVLESSSMPIVASLGQINTHLADQFGLRNGSYATSSRPYWALFDMGPGAYYELVSVTMRLAETARPSSDSDGAAMGRAMEQVFAILSQGPPNIGAFYEIARSNNIPL
mmetsp:Transcript_11724/g.20916  ORF Transcript_11724/g.20916 Transcript_11724/m.20916 type:complete len:515 (-) Transcript_11724:365-1909(-)